MTDRRPGQSAAHAVTTARRLHWVDVAKAVAIVLVVLYHVGGAGMDRMFPDSVGHAAPFWDRVNTVLLPLRMPLFFLTAGLLAHRAVARSWRTVARTRVLALVWPYLLWSLAFAAFAGYAYQPADPGAYAVDRLKAIPFAGTAYWFLAVLTVFFVVAKVLRRWPLTVLVATAALAAAAPYLEPVIDESLPPLMTYAAARVARYAFWYFLGCYAFDVVARLADTPPWPVLVVGGAGFVALTGATYLDDMGRPLAFPLSVTGLAAAVAGSVLVARSARIRSWAQYLAARTLPIYLVHPVLINLLVLATMHLGGPLTPDPTLATALTPILVVLTVAASCLIYDALISTRLAWLFRPPGRPRQTRG